MVPNYWRVFDAHGPWIYPVATTRFDSRSRAREAEYTAAHLRPVHSDTCLAATVPYSAFSLALGLRARASTSIARQ